jgi:hypothetical protein
MVEFGKLLIEWCRGTELNRRRQPFQGCALPPELPRQATNIVRWIRSSVKEAHYNIRHVEGRGTGFHRVSGDTAWEHPSTCPEFEASVRFPSSSVPLKVLQSLGKLESPEALTASARLAVCSVETGIIAV